MTGSLVSRLQEIPGVASVAVDLTDSGGGINVRLEPGADEEQVMESLRTLLVAYGIRSADPKVRLGRHRHPSEPSFDVEVTITPIRSGARVEVSTKNVRSFRVVPATPIAIAQGLADAWCQVRGWVPVEIRKVSIGDDGMLMILASDGDGETLGTSDVSGGWQRALVRAVGQAIGAATGQDLDRRPVAANS